MTTATPGTVSVPLQAGLLEERDVGVLNAAVTLLLGIVSRNYEGGPTASTAKSGLALAP